MTSDNKCVTIICEGKTELYFVKNVLAPYFYNLYEIQLLPNDLNGRVTVDKVVKYIKRAKTKVITSLIDYYGFINPNELTVEELTKEIKEHFETNSVIPYIQMHEIEALWFSNIDKIIEKMNADKKQTEELNRIVNKYSNPEEINNSKETAPSKRLEKIFLGYDKIIDGLNIAKEIDMNTFMAKCPRFSAWINDVITCVNECYKD